MKLTILHTNDVHAEYGPWLKCAAFIKKRRSELPAGSCLTVDSGDHLDMSVDECGLSGGGKIANIRVGGEALDPGRWYRAGGATHLYSSKSGGYPSMDGSRNLEAQYFTYLRDELVDAFRRGEALRIPQGLSG